MKLIIVIFVYLLIGTFIAGIALPDITENDNVVGLFLLWMIGWPVILAVGIIIIPFITVYGIGQWIRKLRIKKGKNE